MSSVFSARNRRRRFGSGIGLTVFILLLAAPSFGQSVSRVGTDDTFDVATWNIEWFGSTNANQGPSDVVQQRENVERVIRESGIDFWAFQEISDSHQFSALLDSLGSSWAGILATTQVTQRIAFLYNTAVVQPVGLPKHILEQYASGPVPPAGTNYFAGRPPLQMEADVVLADTTVRLTLITLHMKCCSDASSYDRRKKASERLKIHIDFTGLKTERVVVLGDFNDLLIGSIGAGSSPYDNFSSDPGNFQFTTLPLAQQEVNTFCFNSACTQGSAIDHVLITNELFSDYESASTDRLGSVLAAIPNYVFSTSDHIPVYARFTFPTNTSSDRADEIPSSLSIDGLYPNPVRDQLRIELTRNKPDLATLEIFDVLGRRKLVRLLAPGPIGKSIVSVDTGGFAAGLYLVRITSGRAVRYGRFVRGRP